MGWTTPTDRATSYVATAVDWNVLEDNETFLYGDTSWTTVPSFSGTWVAGAQAPRYSKSGNTVEIQGAVTGGTINTAAFTLPAGYRPGLLVTFGTSANGAFGAFTVGTGGIVTPVTGSTTQYSLCCRFSVL